MPNEKPEDRLPPPPMPKLTYVVGDDELPGFAVREGEGEGRLFARTVDGPSASELCALLNAACECARAPRFANRRALLIAAAEFYKGQR